MFFWDREQTNNGLRPKLSFKSNQVADCVSTVSNWFPIFMAHFIWLLIIVRGRIVVIICVPVPFPTHNSALFLQAMVALTVCLIDCHHHYSLYQPPYCWCILHLILSMQFENGTQSLITNRLIFIIISMIYFNRSRQSCIPVGRRNLTPPDSYPPRKETLN